MCKGNFYFIIASGHVESGSHVAAESMAASWSACGRWSNHTVRRVQGVYLSHVDLGKSQMIYLGLSAVVQAYDNVPKLIFPDQCQNDVPR